MLTSPLAPLAAPLTAAIASAADAAWAGATHVGARAVALDAAARATPINAAFYALADTERLLAPPGRLVVAALGAFYQEVILPLLRTLGFVTMQTLG